MICRWCQRGNGKTGDSLEARFCPYCQRYGPDESMTDAAGSCDRCGHTGPETVCPNCGPHPLEPWEAAANPEPSEALTYLVLGFVWLVLAGFRLLSHKVSGAVIGVEGAVCYWLQAWLIKAGLKKSSRLLLVLGAFSAFLIADYFAGYLRN